ncbi:ParA family protein (plasmid) [Photobacterium damselae subsp. damselae]|uniref:ParA family protein n=1 Tax=Photobacterium damselae TaxID=38293 RepID=UPI00101271F3|nr:ParA family protein [Photobacterium damselae]QAY37514.1 ParA family protein [Photobacterium damselae subsp. damselae]
MHIIFMNTKGGVGKSTLCEYSGNELERLGYVVSMNNTDQQQHVITNGLNDADYFLYDTAGAFTQENIRLLEALSNPAVNGKIIVPIGVGKNDIKEASFMIDNLLSYDLLGKTCFVFMRTSPTRKALKNAKDILKEKGVHVCKWVMPDLEDFGQGRNTSRTKNEISHFLHEILL